MNDHYKAKISSCFSPLVVIVIALGILIFSSCTAQSVLVVSDPYIKTIEGENWGPAHWLFAVRARMHRLEVRHLMASQDKKLPEIFLELDEPPDILVLSPWNTMNLEEITNLPPRTVIVGGLSPDNLLQKTAAIIADRKQALAEMGRMAGEMALRSATSGVILFQSGSLERLNEKKTLREAYNFIAGEKFPPVVFNISANEDKDLPQGFLSAVSKNSVLMLFAGALNAVAIHATEETRPPIFTERWAKSQAWKYRVVASVEDHPAQQLRSLLTFLTSEETTGIHVYPARIIKGSYTEK